MLFGLGTLGLMLWEPHLEGRNTHATTFEIYLNDPFLAYVYLGSTPFFVALYRGFGLFGHVRQTGTFSQATVEALRSIKHSAIALVGFVAGAVVLILMSGDAEPPGIVMSLVALLASSAVAIAAGKLARHVQSTLKRRSGVMP